MRLFHNFLFNLSTKIPEAVFLKILDRLTFILTTIIDLARFEETDVEIDFIRDEVNKIKCDTLHDAAKHVIECISALLDQDVNQFYTIIDNVEMRSTRIHLYRLQNSLGLLTLPNEKSNSKA